MPIDSDGVGHSEYTEGKLFAFAGLVQMHVRICSGIQRRYERSPYYYFDLNAGVGEVEGQPGSPILAIKTLAQSGLTDWHAFTVDQNPRSPEAIGSQLTDVVHRRHWTGEWGDNRTTTFNWLATIPHGAIGLMFHDVNGRADFDLLRRLCMDPKTRRLDLLIYMAATSWKRYRTGSHSAAKTLLGEIATVNKKYWLLRDARGKHQWTFLFGTNWARFPEWESAGFYRADSPRGQRILAELSETSRERRQKENFNRQALPIDDLPYRTYLEYLRHPRFLVIRAKAMTRAAGKCERCQRRPPSEVHHLAYPRWGTFDVPENLLAVCHSCHCVLEGKIA
jgi:hypothetical protein